MIGDVIRALCVLHSCKLRARQTAGTPAWWASCKAIDKAQKDARLAIGRLFCSLLRGAPGYIVVGAFVSAIIYSEPFAEFILSALGL